eukprot:3501150-Rhodomonas_salina.2
MRTNARSHTNTIIMLSSGHAKVGLDFQKKLETSETKAGGSGAEGRELLTGDICTRRREMRAASSPCCRPDHSANSTHRGQQPAHPAHSD